MTNLPHNTRTGQEKKFPATKKQYPYVTRKKIDITGKSKQEIIKETWLAVLSGDWILVEPVLYAYEPFKYAPALLLAGTDGWSYAKRVDAGMMASLVDEFCSFTTTSTSARKEKVAAPGYLGRELLVLAEHPIDYGHYDILPGLDFIIRVSPGEKQNLPAYKYNQDLRTYMDVCKRGEADPLDDADELKLKQCVGALIGRCHEYYENRFPYIDKLLDVFPFYADSINEAKKELTQHLVEQAQQGMGQCL